MWVILVFEFQRYHDITDARIGIYYTLLALIAVGVMLLVAPRLQPLSLSTTIPLSLGLMSAGSFAMGYLPTTWILLAFALVGIGNGLIDVYLNVAAQRAEARTGKPVLQWMHATYALGGITGALMAGAIRALDIDFRIGLAYAGLALAVTAIWTSSSVPKVRHVEGAQTLFSISALFRAPKLLVPALVVLSSFLIEGSMDVWSGLYLRDQLGASASGAALAFVAFASAVLFGRLFASKVLFGMGRRMTILVAGFGSLIGERSRSPPIRCSWSPWDSWCSASRSPPPFRRRSDWWAIPERIRRTRSPPSPPSATPGSSGAHRCSGGSPRASACGQL